MRLRPENGLQALILNSALGPQLFCSILGGQLAAKLTFPGQTKCKWLIGVEGQYHGTGQDSNPGSVVDSWYG